MIPLQSKTFVDLFVEQGALTNGCFKQLRLVSYQVVIAQWLAQQHATGEVPGSNPIKGENLSISE